jgi:hypothetical protein
VVDNKKKLVENIYQLVEQFGGVKRLNSQVLEFLDCVVVLLGHQVWEQKLWAPLPVGLSYVE